MATPGAVSALAGMAKLQQMYAEGRLPDDFYRSFGTLKVVALRKPAEGQADDEQPHTPPGDAGGGLPVRPAHRNRRNHEACVP